MIAPCLVISAPVRGPQGLRVAPLLAALARIAECLFVVSVPSERDLAPGRAMTMAEWLDDPVLDAVPHLHILADDPSSVTALRAAWRRPGVTVLQDPGLSVAYQSISLDAGMPEAWVRAMAAEHGGAGRRLARAQHAGLFAEGQRVWMPMLDGLGYTAPLLVVRSRHAAGSMTGGSRHVVLAESAPVAVLVPADRLAARAGLRLGPEPLLLVPLRAPAPLDALREVAGLAGAALLPSLPDDALAPQIAACDAALGLSLPFGATPLHKLAAAQAAGRPVLTWEADPAAELGTRTVGFPADGATLAAAIRDLLAAGAGPPATPGPEDEARALLAMVLGCRFGAPAP